MANQFIKEINQALDDVFGSGTHSWVKIYKWPNWGKGLYNYNTVNSSMASFISKKFSESRNDIRIYHFDIINENFNNNNLHWTIIIQSNGKKDKPNIEIVKSKTELGFSSGWTDKNVIKRIRAEDIRDITDFKFYIKGIKKDIDDNNMLISKLKKEAKQKIALYNIEADEQEIIVDQWLEQFAALNYYPVPFEKDTITDDFWSLFDVSNEYKIQEKEINFCLQKDELSVEGKWIFNSDFKLKLQYITILINTLPISYIDNCMIEQYEKEVFNHEWKFLEDCKYTQMYNEIIKTNGDFETVKKWILSCEDIFKWWKRKSNK